MSVTPQILAAFVAAMHVAIFVMESVLWMRPAVYRRFGVAGHEEATITRRFAYNQGFYNLFLAVGIVVGLILLHTDAVDAGRALVVFGCGCVLAAALVLAASGRRMLRAAVVQGLPAALALLSLAL
jgi:putative membrane protein